MLCAAETGAYRRVQAYGFAALPTVNEIVSLKSPRVLVDVTRHAMSYDTSAMFGCTANTTLPADGRLLGRTCTAENDTLVRPSPMPSISGPPSEVAADTSRVSEVRYCPQGAGSASGFM